MNNTKEELDNIVFGAVDRALTKQAELFKLELAKMRLQFQDTMNAQTKLFDERLNLREENMRNEFQRSIRTPFRFTSCSEEYRLTNLSF